MSDNFGCKDINKSLNEIYERLLNLEYEIKLIKQQKVDIEALSELYRELTKLSSKLEEVINDRTEDKAQRNEDKALINCVITKVNDMNKVINETIVDNGIIKTNQENTLEKVEDLKVNINSIHGNINTLKDEFSKFVSNSNSSGLKPIINLINKNKFNKYCAKFVGIFFILLLLSAFLFYNDMKWNDIFNTLEKIKNIKFW